MTLALELRCALAEDLSTEVWTGSWALGRKDRRYAAFIAYVLDVLANHDWAVGIAAAGLGVSTGKLIRVLAQDPQTWNVVNQARKKIDLVNLRRP
ncbi:hypothetical protein GCM10011309_22970 [Litorimonas cladophorae]|uniref:Uncharacterized protein n=1 Tax=Litorimonas cladophorae TaxID=1220491 RepID=A0A918KPW5_9PROT|nr:hypothetical protein GCM10011309_22970 [Litorimonas cladophorae]